MDVATAAAADGAPHGTAVIARRQTAGRGTRNRRWVSDEGGAWLSVVIRPDVTVGAEVASLRVGMAVITVLERLVPALPPLGIKWPNDILADGGKIAGILCESRWIGTTCAWIVAGVGINVANALPDVSYRVARVADWDAAADQDAIAAAVAGQVALATSDGGYLAQSELDAFAVRDVLCGSAIPSHPGAIADGITAAGALRLRYPDGRVIEATSALAVRLVSHETASC